jgi:hypothetical protein
VGFLSYTPLLLIFLLLKALLLFKHLILTDRFLPLHSALLLVLTSEVILLHVLKTIRIAITKEAAILLQYQWKAVYFIGHGPHKLLMNLLFELFNVTTFVISLRLAHRL